MTGHDAEGPARLRCAENAAMLAWRLDGVPGTMDLVEVIAHAAVAIAAVEAEADWIEPADFAFDEVADLIRGALDEDGGLAGGDLGVLRALVQAAVAPYLRGAAS